MSIETRWFAFAVMLTHFSMKRLIYDGIICEELQIITMSLADILI